KHAPESMLVHIEDKQTQHIAGDRTMWPAGRRRHARFTTDELHLPFGEVVREELVYGHEHGSCGLRHEWDYTTYAVEVRYARRRAEGKSAKSSARRSEIAARFQPASGASRREPKVSERAIASLRAAQQTAVA